MEASENKKFALVPRPLGAIEKAEPGTKRVLSGMVAETLALANQTKTPKRRGTLLIVDDEDGPLQSLRVVFEGEYDLFTSEDGPTAIKLAQESDIDVVLTDIRMPGMSGIEVLERLKISKPDIEVIVMTAFETTDTKKQALRLRAFDYINKPFDMATIRSVVSKAMQRRMVESKIKAARNKSSNNTEKLANQTPFKRRGLLLIVDDEGGPRQSLRVIFKDEFDMLMAEDGPTAIKLAQENDIDVVVTNIRMAGMSGIEVLEWLKTSKPDIEVIIMTGMETTDTIRQALQLRAFDYINKPFDIATIRSAVSKAMRRRTLEAK